MIELNGRRWLTTPEAAAALGLAPSTLRTHRSDGRGVPSVKIGSAVLYDADLVQALARTCQIA
jgi:hypothetical protein